MRNFLKSKFNLETPAEICLIIMSFVLFMAKSWESSIHGVDSALHARLALEVTKNGWLPALPMPSYAAYDTRPFFNDHPFTLFYLVGQWMRFFGADAWSARFIPGLFGVATVFLLLQIGKKYFAKAVGFGAAFILMVTPMFLQLSARFQLDPSMTFFILLSYYYWLGKRDIHAGLSVAAAVLFKAPTGFLLLPAALVSGLIRERKLSISTFFRLLKVTAVAIFWIGLFWVWVNHLAGENLFLDYFRRQVWGTSAHGRFESRGYSPFYFFTILRQQYWLWLTIALIGAVFFFRRKSLRTKVCFRPFANEPLSLSVAMGVIVVLIISLVRFQASNYFLPAFPFLALWFAQWIDLVFETFWNKVGKLLVVLTPLMMLLMLICPISTGPEMIPAFRHFAPYIQNAGTCSDVVMFVDTGGIYGGQNTYFCEVAFYTGRKMLHSDCNQALEQIKTKKPAWILFSDGAQENCFKKNPLPDYPTRIKFGTQFLWGIYPMPKDEIDLTPLYRELKPPVDCKPIELKNTPWIEFSYQRYFTSKKPALLSLSEPSGRVGLPMKRSNPPVN